MSQATIFFGAIVTLVTAMLYLAVGIRMLRHSSDRARPFAYFWLGLGAWATMHAAWSLTLLAGVDLDIRLSIIILHLKVAAGVLGFYGFCRYLSGLGTRSFGSPRMWTLVYAGIYGLVAAFYVWHDPIGTTWTLWEAQLVYGRENGTLWMGVVLALFGPPLASMAAYGIRMLRGQTEQSTRARRVAMLGCAAFATLLVGWIDGSWLFWGFVEKIIGLSLVCGLYLIMESATPAADEFASI